MNKYLALLLLPLSSSVMAFNDTDEFSNIFLGASYNWYNLLYSSDNLDLASEASPTFSIGYNVDENSTFIISYQDTLSYTSITYKRSVHRWSFEQNRFIPYFSGSVSMGNDEVGDVLGFDSGFGLDYRLNSYVELTTGFSLSNQLIDIEGKSSYGMSAGVNFGLNIYPF